MMKNFSKNKTVYVAMSGGVDSSVAAALLQKEGYDCVGVYMKNWSGDDYGLQADCPWEEDMQDVEKVCEKLNIPFRSYNFEKEYRGKVVEYFFSEYEAGRTPNPDVMCNKEIKFHLFLEKALSEGADLIATGHYARVEKDGKSFNLLKGVDNNKDQSYFLYNLTQEQLSKTLFPIGGYEKKEIRQLAHKFSLPVADKPDSQGICFIGEINVQEFLRQRIKPHEGEIVDIDTQRIVGKHDGIEFFTLGQREGLGIGGAKEPYFVAKKDKRTNTLYVAQGAENKHLLTKQLTLENLHLINDSFDPSSMSGLSAAVRYRQKPQPCAVKKDSERFTIEFEEPQRAVTPGQSLVLYKDEVCLGGGIIS